MRPLDRYPELRDVPYRVMNNEIIFLGGRPRVVSRRVFGTRKELIHFVKSNWDRLWVLGCDSPYDRTHYLNCVLESRRKVSRIKVTKD